jgi:hypothetical protein
LKQLHLGEYQLGDQLDHQRVIVSAQLFHTAVEFGVQALTLLGSEVCR